MNKVVHSGNLSQKAVQEYVNKMTNWQRKQWTKAGYPKTKSELERFISLTKS